MNTDTSIVVRKPATPSELILLFHGVGSAARHLVPLAEFIANQLPLAMVVSVEAPYASDFGNGRQWFSVRNITEDDRPERIVKAMPVFQQTVSHWQAAAGVSPNATTLIGFSQGAIMSLESTQADPPVAGRIVSLSGRFASSVRRAPSIATIDLIHGDADAVVASSNSIRAAEQLRGLGANVTLSLVPSLGHEIDGRVAELVLERVRESNRLHT